MQAHNKTGTIELCHTSCVCGFLTSRRFVLMHILQALYDGGSLETYLTSGQSSFVLIRVAGAKTFSVKSWMDNNTNDGMLPALCSFVDRQLISLFCSVVSLLIVNSDGFSASDFASVFESAGLDTMSYSPSSSNLTYSEWPTLSTLIDAGTRLVTFMDTHADFSTATYIIDGTSLTSRSCVGS